MNTTHTVSSDFHAITLTSIAGLTAQISRYADSMARDTARIVRNIADGRALFTEDGTNLGGTTDRFVEAVARRAALIDLFATVSHEPADRDLIVLACTPNEGGYSTRFATAS